MSIRFKKSASVAILALAGASPLFADGGQWSNRFWGLGWGDGYHAPPRTGGMMKGLGGHAHAHHGGHVHGPAHHGPAVVHAGGAPGGLMPGGYPDRGHYDDAPGGPRLPQWLWDPSDETVIVDAAPQSLPQDAQLQEDDPVPPPPQLPAAKPAKDPSLGMPPAVEPTSRTDARAMRRGLIQARWNGESR